MTLSKTSISRFVWVGSVVFLTVSTISFVAIFNLLVDKVTQNQLEPLIKQISIQSKNISVDDLTEQTEALSWLDAVPYIKQAVVFGKNAETLFYYKKPNQEVTHKYANQWRQTFTKTNHYSDSEVLHTLQPIDGTHQNVESIYLEVDKRLLQKPFHPILLGGYAGLVIFFLTILATVWFFMRRYVLPVRRFVDAVLETKQAQLLGCEQSLQDIERTIVDLQSDNQNWVEHSKQLDLKLKQQTDETLEIVNRLIAQYENEKNTKLALINLSGRGLKALVHKMINDVEFLKVHITESQIHEKASQLNDSVHELLDVIERLQIYSKLNDNQLPVELQQTDLYRLLHSVLESNQAKASQNEHTLTLSFQCDVREAILDPHKLRQILNNLIDNAIRFSLPGNIELSLVESTNETKPFLTFSVSDPGPIIDTVEQQRIFEPFQQASNNEQAMTVGLGLGLAISSQLISLMLGDYGLEATNKGNRFWFTLPIEVISRSTVLPEEKPSSLKTSAAKALKTILVVEDNEVNQSVALNMLEKLDCKVDLASDGKEALDACRVSEYDMILMDYHMPMMSGIEVTQQIREGLKLTVPIIALTADDDEQVKSDFYAAGANDILIKPVNFNKLVDLLTRFLGDTKEKLPESTTFDHAKGSTPILNMRVVDDIRAMAGESGQQMVEQIFQVYMEHTPSLIQAIKQAYKNQNAEQLFKSAHALKSSSLNIGASAVAELAKQIEMLARQNNLDQIGGYIDKLDTHYVELTSFLDGQWRGI